MESLCINFFLLFLFRKFLNVFCIIDGFMVIKFDLVFIFVVNFIIGVRLYLKRKKLMDI